LFLWHRYTGLTIIAVNSAFFLSRASTGLCQGWIQFEGATGILSIVNIEIIMIFRVWALYGRKQIVLIALVIMLCMEVITISTIMHIGLSKIEVLPRIGELWTGCYPSGFPHLLSAFYIPPSITTCILTLMTLYKSLSVLNNSAFKSRLTVLFTRDGLMYFGIILSAYITNAVIWLIARPTLAQVAIGIVLAARIVVAARLLLNLKEEGSPQNLSYLESHELRHYTDKRTTEVQRRAPATMEAHSFVAEPYAAAV